MTPKQIRDNKIQEIVARISNEMHTHYYGGDTIFFKNVSPQLDRRCINLPIFSANELRMIRNEKILDIIAEDGWDCVLDTYGLTADDDAKFASFTFTAKQEVIV